MRRPKISSAHVISLVALFISIGGTAFAAATIGSSNVVNDSLKSKDLKDNKAVQSVDVVDGSLTGGDLADGTVATGDLANNAVTSTKIADGAVGTADLADNSVTSAKVVNDTLTGDDISESTLATVPLASKLANLTVTRVEFTAANGAEGGGTATCPTGTQAISGGVRNDPTTSDTYVEVSRPVITGTEGPTDGQTFDGWRAVVFNQTDAESGQAVGANTAQSTVWAVCAG
jgi:hypothetical protein